MQIVPLQAVPSQTVTIVLGGQYCQINVYQRRTGLFLDLYVDNTPMLFGVIGQNINRIVRSTYLGFVGDLMFLDNQGASDPTYDGLGGRYSLAYLSTDDLASAGLAA